MKMQRKGRYGKGSFAVATPRKTYVKPKEEEDIKHIHAAFDMNFVVI